MASLARHIAVRHGVQSSVTTLRRVTNLPKVLHRRRFGHVANTKLCLIVTTCRQWRYFCNFVLAGLDFGSFAGYMLKSGALLTTAPHFLAFSMSISAKSCRHRGTVLAV